MILMGNRFTVRFLVSGLPAERVKFGFLKDYAIRGKINCFDGMTSEDAPSAVESSRVSL